MKRWISIWVSICLLIGLAGCGSQGNHSSTPGFPWIFSFEEESPEESPEESQAAGSAEESHSGEESSLIDPEESSGKSREDSPESSEASVSPSEPETGESSLPEDPQEIPENYEDEEDLLYGLESHAAVLLRNGVPIAGKNAEETMYPASITKVMTALVAYEHLDLDETVEMTEDIVSAVYVQDLSMAGFLDGDEATVRDYIYGLLVPSGAECALLLAELVAGSEEEFAVLMNEKAEELGLTGSHFTNPYGAHDDEQVITAIDAARLLEAAMENPFLREVMCTPSYTTAPSENYSDGLTFYHVLVYYMHGDDDWPFGGLIYGGKTGTTTPAGKCLASFSEIGGDTYILATLGAYEEGSGQVRDALTVYGRLKAIFEPEEETEDFEESSEDAEEDSADGSEDAENQTE